MFLIFKFIHMLFALKIDGIFEKIKVNSKELKDVIFFIYSIDIWESGYDKILETRDYFQSIYINLAFLLNKFIFYI